MPQIIPALVAIGTGLEVIGVALGVSSGIGAIVAGAAVVAGSAVAASRMLTPDIAIPMSDTSASRQSTVRSTVEPQKVIYGTALVSGPVTFVAVSGTDNRDLYHQIALAGHECESITDIYFDNDVIAASAINSGNAAGGDVTTGTFGPSNGTTICKINKHLGTATQSADADLVAAFTNYTSAHQGKGIANIVTKWTLTDESQQDWDKKKPTDVKALVKGKKDIYDPRLDTSAGANPSNSSYQAWSDNPALCIANYLTDTTFGLGVAASKIDWAAVVTAADACDVSVDIPGSTTQKRFTANGVLFATDTHRANIDKLLSAMNGDLIYTSGQYIIHAGVYAAPSESLDEDDLAGPISVKTSVERSARFNKVTGTYISPSENHKSIEFPAVQLTAALNRDNGETLTKNVNLPFTNSSYMAQRLANKMVQLSDQQKVIVWPANFTGLRIAVGDRVSVTVEELNYSNKVFRCVGWSFSDSNDNGVNLTLVEDDSGSYADPAVSAYSTVSASGVLTQGFPGVPDPQNLTATAGLKNIELNWTNPTQTSLFTEIAVYASPNSSWASRILIGRVRGTQFIHDASNAADAITAGDQRYYWVQALAYGTGAGFGVVSDRNPDNDTSNVVAVCGRVNWSDVSGTTNAPADNATVGATFGTDITDGSGNTVGFTSVDNSVLSQQILNVETQPGQVLDLETGVDVAIQNLGDVAIFVSDNSILLKSNIDTVSNSLSNLEGTVADITSGTSDVFVSASAPVAGVGGVPDPIPTFSRWYDSSNNNAPYYWTGSAWVSLEDPRIASNAASITSLSASLNTTNTNVTTAQNTADSKIVALFQDNEPATTNRITGDLWFDTNDANKMYRFDSTLTPPQWVLSRDTGIQSAIDAAAAAASTADGKIDSFYQNNEPAANVSSTGDLWFDTNEGNKVYRYNGTAWQVAQDSQIATAIANAASAQAAADGKVTTFFSATAPTAEGVGDLWFDTSDKNKLKRWSGTAWVEVSNTDIAQAITDAADAQATADGKIVTFVQDNAPTATSTGDLWIDSNDNNKLYRWSGTAWVAVRDGGIEANANSISVLDSTVTNIDGTVTALSASNTTLVSDFNVRTKIQDENNADLETETSAQVQTETIDSVTAGLATADQTLQTQITATDATVSTQSTQLTELSASLDSKTLANANAVSAIDVRVTSAEGSISTQAQEITSLSASLGAKITTFYQDDEPTSANNGDLWFDTNDNNKPYRYDGTATPPAFVLVRDGVVTANADAVSTLNTSVTQINTLDGTSTSANATQLVSLRATVENPTTGLAATAGTLATLTANVSDGAALASDNKSLFAAVGVTVTDNWDSTRTYAAGDGVVSSGKPYVALRETIGDTPATSTDDWSEISTAAALITENNTARIGYCVDANGDLTDHKNATLCLAAGNTWNGDAALAQAVKALTVIKPDGTFANIQDATGVISNDVGDVTAQKFIKIDTNGRIAGYGISSTTSTGSTTSDFTVIADKFSVVDPSSTADNPIVPFSISNSKIVMTSDVEINGSLMVGTINADRLSIDGSFLSVVGGALTVTSAPGSTTGRSFSTTSTIGGFGATSTSIAIASTNSVKVTYDITANGTATFGQSSAFPATFEIHKSTNGGSTFSVVKSIKINPTADNNVDLVAGFYQAALNSGEPGITYLSADGSALLSAPASGSENAIFKCRLQFSNSTGINSVDVNCLLEVF